MKKFTKDDLKVGMLVMFRNEWRRIVMPETMGDLYLMGCTEAYSLDNYSDDLKCNSNNDYDIIGVYSLPVGYVVDVDIYDLEYRDLIWKRNEPKKLTVEDIEELLGYKIEIVSSN